MIPDSIVFKADLSQISTCEISLVYCIVSSNITLLHILTENSFLLVGMSRSSILDLYQQSEAFCIKLPSFLHILSIICKYIFHGQMFRRHM